MPVIDTIPTSDATKPTALSSQSNGQLPASWLRSFDGTTRDDYKAFVPISYALQAMHLAAAKAGITLKTTGRYRSYARQEALFRERYTTTYLPNRPYKTWNGVRWYQKPGVAMAATPGTSNHGWGIADDISEYDPGDTAAYGSTLDEDDLVWLRDNAPSFGFGLDTRIEPWHWHWYRPDGTDRNALTQRTVDVLNAAGIKVPNLSTWGFTAPAPSGGGDEAPKPLVMKSGGSPQSNWTGWYSMDDGHTRIALTSMPDAQHMTVTLGALDAKTRQRPTDPMGWSDVSWAASEAELAQYIGTVPTPKPGPTPDPEPEPDPGSSYGLYTVQVGDSWWRIGQLFGIPYQDLMAFNGTTDTLVVPGQVIKIPGLAQHTVTTGESWWSISHAAGITVDALLKLNPPAVATTVIHPGQTVNVPV